MKACLFALLLHASALQGWAADPETFVSADADRVYTLDPAAIYDRQSFSVALNIYEPLVAFGSEGAKPSLVPFLSAEVPSVENGLLSKDGLTYSFPIRKDVRFHHGGELTPEDVRYSLLRFLLRDPEGGPAGILLKPILGVYSTRDENGALVVRYSDAAQAVRVEGDKVVIQLRSPYAPFLSIIASWPLVTSKSWAAAHGDWDGEEAAWQAFNNQDFRKSYLSSHANGTGPFMLDASSASANLVVLKRHEAYWRGPARLKTVVLRQIDSELARLSLLQTGDADHASLSRASLGDIAGSGAMVLDDLPGSAIGPAFFFTFEADPKDNPALGSGRLDGEGIPPDFFKDPDVRRGFACAFDYELFLNTALRGKGERAEGPLPLKSFGLSAGSPPCGHDRAKAEQHLQKAWAGLLWRKGFKAEAAYNANDPAAHAAAENLSAGLRAIRPSFSLTPKPFWKSTLEKEALRHRLPVFISGFEADYPDLHSYAFSLLHSAGFFPKAQRYSNPAADAIVDEARRSPDDSARAKAYGELQALYKKDLPQVYLYAPVNFKALRTGISGAQPAHGRLDPFTLHNALYFYRIRKD
ncbi:MAG: ABC transporter substrate-binding protein [Elusimicrobia bacterium]|nr:ABC transporter substrate-binding protein [Elusimicrobiota bacterium]